MNPSVHESIRQSLVTLHSGSDLSYLAMNTLDDHLHSHQQSHTQRKQIKVHAERHKLHSNEEKITIRVNLERH